MFYFFLYDFRYARCVSALGKSKDICGYFIEHLLYQFEKRERVVSFFFFVRLFSINPFIEWEIFRWIFHQWIPLNFLSGSRMNFPNHRFYHSLGLFLFAIASENFIWNRQFNWIGALDIRINQNINYGRDS